MKKLSIVLAAVLGLSANIAIAEETYPAGHGGVHSLRGSAQLDETRPADAFKQPPRQQELSTTGNFVFQPPLVPHDVRGLQVDKRANSCLSCHSWTNSEASGAVRISVTHYMNRDDQVLSDMSPRRYFCLQCHVPQVEADAPVGNDFAPVQALK